MALWSLHAAVSLPSAFESRSFGAPGWLSFTGRYSPNVPLIGTPEAFGKMIVAETAKWKKVVEGAGIKVE